MSKSTAGDDTHVVRQVVFVPFQGAGGYVVEFRPRVTLEFFPVRDWAPVFLHEQPTGLPRERGRRVVCLVPVELQYDVFGSAANVIITQEGLDGYLFTQRICRVAVGQKLKKPECITDGVLHFRVQKEFNVVNAFRRPLAAQAKKKIFPVRVHRSRKACECHCPTFPSV